MAHYMLTYRAPNEPFRCFRLESGQIRGGTFSEHMSFEFDSDEAESRERGFATAFRVSNNAINAVHRAGQFGEIKIQVTIVSTLDSPVDSLDIPVYAAAVDRKIQETIKALGFPAGTVSGVVRVDGETAEFSSSPEVKARHGTAYNGSAAEAASRLVPMQGSVPGRSPDGLKKS